MSPDYPGSDKFWLFLLLVDEREAAHSHPSANADTGFRRAARAA